ncbi:MAG: gliding motility-associated C-terminal domain-containing protein [Bacteroidota bacterium]|nr:gliding motility-associated C-terminal domain-containing protein [Bacteroidota bacterium]
MSGFFPAISQTPVSVVINRYAKVVSLQGTDGITVDNASGFGEGDTVLVIQMKGAEFLPVLNSKGKIVNALQNIANTGRYEFVAIQSVTGNQIKFRSNLLNIYDASQSVQIVRVPSYNYAKVTSAGLTCLSWDGNKGGVLAMIVNDTLLLNGNIDVSGKGFRGAEPTVGVGTCYNYPDQRNYTNVASDSAGLKGESLAASSFPYTRGRGDLGNGGGGGNGIGSGGGGGGGFGQGGYGGTSSCTTWTNTDTNLGGLGGNFTIDYFGRKTIEPYRDRIFLGGGGGAGRGLQVNDGTSGGNGGGIIFLVTYHLKTNGYSISANGANVPGTAVNNAGAGAGGGGGSVMLAFEKVTGDTVISISGGNGGNTNHCSGQGGGGGGGFLWVSGQKLPAIHVNLAAGESGQTIPVNCVAGQSNGNEGWVLGELDPIFNGFLFNMIINHSDTICFRDTPTKIKATKPRGGGGSYTFQWQSRNKPNQAWTNIIGATDTTYAPPALTDTTYFRRIVKSPKINDPLSFTTDTSKSIVINVVPEIKSNLIAPDTIVCKGLTPIKIRGTAAYGGDTKSPIGYLWEESSDKTSWNAVSSLYKTSQEYPTPSNQETRYYRRKVLNNICTVISDTVKITILNRISGNILNPVQIICSGTTPTSLQSGALSGGDGAYHYKWQQSTDDSLHWVNIGTSAAFSPGALTDTIYYRRMVYSGLNETCIDTSKALKITTLPKIGNNLISGQTICSGTAPATFIGTSPVGGDKTYRYSWQSSGDNASWTTLSPAIQKDYTNGILTSTTFFRRIVASGLNDCCKDTCVAAKVTVQPAIKNNTIGSNQTICYGQKPVTITHTSGQLTGGDNTSYTFLWQKHYYSSPAWIDVTGLQTNYQLGALTDTTYIRCIVTSGVCTDNSNIVTVKVLPSLVNNTVTGSAQVCEQHIPGKLTGGVMSGGLAGDYRYLWQDSIIGGTWQNISGAQVQDYSSGIITQPTFFRRVVKSGLNDCCLSNSLPFLISIDQQPKDPDAGENQKLVYKFSTHLNAPVPLVGSGVWTAKLEGPVVGETTSPTSVVENLSMGNNVFFWTITNGVCPSVTDSVVVEVVDVIRYTGFTPNNDGKNDYFVIEGLENAKTKELKVFTRWGTEVYSSGNYQNDWDGTGKHGEKLPDDTYYYVLIADNHVHKGFVVIRR